jgi:hypothetical protein
MQDTRLRQEGVAGVGGRVRRADETRHSLRCALLSVTAAAGSSRQAGRQAVDPHRPAHCSG